MTAESTVERISAHDRMPAAARERRAGRQDPDDAAGDLEGVVEGYQQ
ncbi:MAG TPA: hypothetical protein VLL25_10335 [Acidimicrobiales bacterium]|nr:hypothetical protein [Acidimicrobiales bacterium]